MSRDEFDKLLEFYNGAAQFHATSMIVVVFGQFSILILLQGRLHCPTACLTWANLYGLFLDVLVASSLMFWVASCTV